MPTKLSEIVPESYDDGDRIHPTKKVYDGVYDVTNIDIISFGYHFGEITSNIDKVKKFVEDHDDIYIATPYQTFNGFLLSAKPKEINWKKIIGADFNYGASTMIRDCPQDILILFQDD